MFGITPLGWLHTLGSLPAIPAAFYMLGRHGRIVPRSRAGAVYFASMLVGATTVFLVATQPVGNLVALATLALLLFGYGIGRVRPAAAGRYAETIALTLTVFLLLVPTATEILRRVPDGAPLVTDLRSPLLRSVHGALLAALAIGLLAQVFALRRAGRARGAA